MTKGVVVRTNIRVACEVESGLGGSVASVGLQLCCRPFGTACVLHLSGGAFHAIFANEVRVIRF